MPVDVKICGITSAAAMQAAIDGGAAMVGLMFYPPSPRILTHETARALAAVVPGGITRVGVIVDEPDETIAAIVGAVPLEALQLHGHETPERVAEIGKRFGVKTIKAVRIAGVADIETARAFEDAADVLLFDAKPPADMTDALPGGNALAFDWKLLAGTRWAKPWMLSGGLDAANLADAVRISGAGMVDVSSGVETAPGRKDPALIRAFLAEARAL